MDRWGEDLDSLRKSGLLGTLDLNSQYQNDIDSGPKAIDLNCKGMEQCNGFSQIAYAANLIFRANLLLTDYVYCYMHGPSRTFESVLILKEGIIIYIYIYILRG